MSQAQAIINLNSSIFELEPLTIFTHSQLEAMAKSVSVHHVDVVGEYSNYRFDDKSIICFNKNQHHSNEITYGYAHESNVMWTRQTCS